MKFTVDHSLAGSFARTGTLDTAHGRVVTPAFMPVGTMGAVKTLAPWELEELGSEIILGNTYHLHLRPGENVIQKTGGLQKWTGWNKPILTDSGGYQAFSLGKTKANMAKTTDRGVQFYSHLDGKKLFFTPESVIDIQLKLGSDIVMVLDDCAPYPSTTARLQEGVARTGEWAKKSVDYWQQIHNLDLKACPSGKICGKALFGIVQGGTEKSLRQQSLNDIQSLPFDGIAIGGVSVGEGKENMLSAVDFISSDLDRNRPHYLMGVGEPTDLINMVYRGIDMFDCVLPTRLARHGSFWTSADFRRYDISLSEFTNDSKPLDPNCKCKFCQKFSRSYLRHLYVSGEILALRALTYHNLWLVNRLMDDLRTAIQDGSYEARFASFLRGA